MSFCDGYELFENADQVPEYAKEKLSDFFLERFTGRTEDLFVEMAGDLPKTYAAIESCFGPPLIGTRYVPGAIGKSVDLLLLAEGRCLVGKPHTRLYYDLFDMDDVYQMLPKGIRAYYVVTDDLQIVEDSGHVKAAFTDFPLSRTVRMTLRDAALHLNFAGGYFRNVPAPRHSRVWMVSERDLLIVDESKGRLLHADVTRPSDLVELDDPVGIWDD